MSIACAVLLGFLCVSPPAAPYAHYSSMLRPLPLDRYDPARAKRDGIEVLAWSSDALTDELAIGFNRACDDGWCIAYRRHCDENKCVWEFGPSFRDKPDGLPSHFTVNTGVEIAVRHHRDLGRMARRLRIVAHDADGSEVVAIPLARMNVESAELNTYASCSPVYWFQGCPKPEYPQLKTKRHP